MTVALLFLTRAEATSLSPFLPRADMVELGWLLLIQDQPV